MQRAKVSLLVRLLVGVYAIGLLWPAGEKIHIAFTVLLMVLIVFLKRSSRSKTEV